MKRNTSLDRYIHEQIAKKLHEMTGADPAVDGGMLDPGKVDENPDDRMGHLDPAKVEEATGALPLVRQMADPSKLGEDPDERMGHLDPAKVEEATGPTQRLSK